MSSGRRAVVCRRRGCEQPPATGPAALPDALLLNIFSLLNGNERDRLACSCVCSNWRRLISLHPRPLVVDRREYQQSLFRSLQQAIDAAKPGQIVVVGPGRYEEEVLVDKSVVIIASKAAKLCGGIQTRRSARKAPRITAASGLRTTLMLCGPASPVIMGLTIRFRGRMSQCTVSVSDGCQARLEGCDVSGVFDGISVSGEGAAAAVLGCHVHGCLVGVQFGQGGCGRVEGCLITGGVKVSDGVVVTGVGHVDIRNNRFEDLDMSVQGGSNRAVCGNELVRVQKALPAGLWRDPDEENEPAPAET